MSRWSDFGRALAADTLKIRKTLALWLVSVLPAGPAALQSLLLLHGSNRPPARVDPWLWLSYGVMLLWTMLVLPLFIALETSLLAGVEHGANGWKHLFALPVRRGSVYAAKITIALSLVTSAHAMLCIWTVAAGEIVAALRPDLGFGPVPPRELFVLAAASCAGSASMLSIHAWISLRWPSLVLNMGIAVMALVVNLSLVESDLRRFYPWFVPAEVTNRIFGSLLDGTTAAAFSEPVATPLLASVLGGALVGLAAVATLSRRDVR